MDLTRRDLIKGAGAGAAVAAMAGAELAPAGEADGDPGRLEIQTGRLAPDTRRRLNAAERPAEPAQSQDLLLFVGPQDVGHVSGEITSPRRRQLGGGMLLRNHNTLRAPPKYTLLRFGSLARVAASP